MNKGDSVIYTGEHKGLTDNDEQAIYKIVIDARVRNSSGFVCMVLIAPVKNGVADVKSARKEHWIINERNLRVHPYAHVNINRRLYGKFGP